MSFRLRSETPWRPATKVEEAKPAPVMQVEIMEYYQRWVRDEAARKNMTISALVNQIIGRAKAETTYYERE